jgi:hypothetical protein
MQIVSNPVTVAALSILVYFATTKIIAAVKHAREESAKRNKANIDTVARLAISQEALAAELATARTDFAACLRLLASRTDYLTESLNSSAKASEKILEGTTKACEAIAVATDKHRETVAEFTKLVVGPGMSKDSLETATDEHKDRVFSEMAHRAAGETPERARELAELEEMQAANSYPTV